MNRELLALTIMVFLLVAGCGTGQLGKQSHCAEPMLVHTVYFTLKDGSDTATNKLTNDCYKYLKDHPGLVFFAAGPLAEEFNRPANVRDFQVGLHIVFETEKFHDSYQTSDKHLQFIKENKDSFKKVRVFDTLARQAWTTSPPYHHRR